jgi:RNA polymerase sigma factor (sigma-70 family)
LSRVLHRLSEADTDLANERARLVRLCTRLTDDREAAEDLAQETLLVAWRDAHALRDPLARERWLAGIARNHCLRWARARGRERRRMIVAGTRGEVADAGAIEQVADDFDLAVALERDELAELLDRALALLPPASRDVLVARYVDESPYAAIAARLGVSEKAVSMRLARGKLLLRRALATDLRAEALVYGLPRTVEDADWGETRIWCPNCGRRRLIGRFDRAIHELHLRCPECHPRTGVEVCSATWPAALAGVRGYKAAFSRVARLATAQYRHALEHGAAPCIRCGRPARLRMGMPPDLPPAARAFPGAHLACPACGFVCNQALRGLALALPEARAFWRAHPRIRIPPERPLAEVAGHPAILTRIEDATGAAGLDILSAAADFRVLAIHGAP